MWIGCSLFCPGSRWAKLITHFWLLFSFTFYFYLWHDKTASHGKPFCISFGLTRQETAGFPIGCLKHRIVCLFTASLSVQCRWPLMSDRPIRRECYQYQSVQSGILFFLLSVSWGSTSLVSLMTGISNCSYLLSYIQYIRFCQQGKAGWSIEEARFEKISRYRKNRHQTIRRSDRKPVGFLSD